MSDFKKLDNTGHRIYNFLTNPKVVKSSFYAATIIFISCLIIGYVVAQLDLPGPGIDDAGFTFMEDFISNLGNRNYTPITNFLDDGAMFSAMFLIPLAFYMEKLLGESVEGEKNLMRKRLSSYALLAMLIGIVGLWGIGFFNEEIGAAFGDVVFGLDFHKIFSAVVFLGLGNSGLVYGILIVFYPTRFPKILGIYMIFVPFTLAVSYLTISPLIVWLEWVLLLSLFGYLIPCGVILIKQINENESATKKESKKEKRETAKRSFKERIIQIQEVLTTPKIVKHCLILFFIVFIPSLIVGYLFANIFDPSSDGFDIVKNFISDLGSLNYTHVPKFLDDAAMISAILLVPVMFYLKKNLCTVSKIREEKQQYKAMKLVLSNLSLFFGIMAMVGFFGIGFFSEDTSRELNRLNVTIFGMSTHMFFSILDFASLICTGILMGIFFVMFPRTVSSGIGRNLHPRYFVLLGLEMIAWPTIHGIGFIANWPPSRMFHEWFMLFAILTWSIPLFVLLLKKTKDQIITQNNK